MKFQLSTIFFCATIVALAVCLIVNHQQTRTHIRLLEMENEQRVKDAIVATRLRTDIRMSLKYSSQAKTQLEAVPSRIRMELRMLIYQAWRRSEEIDAFLEEDANQSAKTALELAYESLVNNKCYSFDEYLKRCEDLEKKLHSKGLLFPVLTEPESEEYTSLRNFIESAIQYSGKQP